MPKVNTGTSSVPTHHCHSYCLRRMKSHREPCGDQCGTWWEFLIFRCSGRSSGASRRLSHGETHFESWLPVVLLSCKHTENLQILNTLEKKKTSSRLSLVLLNKEGCHFEEFNFLYWNLNHNPIFHISLDCCHACVCSTLFLIGEKTQLKAPCYIGPLSSKLLLSLFKLLTKKMSHYLILG